MTMMMMMMMMVVVVVVVKPFSMRDHGWEHTSPSKAPIAASNVVILSTSSSFLESTNIHLQGNHYFPL